MRTWQILVAAILLAASGFPIGVVARQATPTSAQPIPASSEHRPDCPVRQVSPADLVAILREPVPEDPDAVDPRGDAVPPAERATVSDLVATWQLCLASGDIPGVLGLFSGDGIRRLLGERSPFLGGPAGLRVSIISISQVERLRDGRIAARISVDPSGMGATPPESLIALVAQREDGLWRIDHLRLAQGPAGTTGTAEQNPA